MSSAEMRKIIYAVEVSGWDHNVDFFVEKTWIEEGPGGHKRVALRNRLREGSVVFIGPVDRGNHLQAFPVAYRAEQVGPLNAHGLQAVNLERLSVQNSRPKKVRDQVA